MSNDLARLIDAEAELDDEDDESFDENEEGEERPRKTTQIDDSSEEEEEDDEEEERKVREAPNSLVMGRCLTQRRSGRASL